MQAVHASLLTIPFTMVGSHTLDHFLLSPQLLTRV